MLPRQPNGGGEFGDVDKARSYLASLHAWEAQRDKLIAVQTAARATLDDATQRATSLSGWATQLNAALQATTQNAGTLTQDNAAIDATTASIATLDGEIEDTAQAHEVATARLLGGPPTTVPLVLLPLRLETRWNAGTLQVRIYPDVASIDSHQPKLTPQEQTAGAAFWQLRGRAGVKSAAIDQAWAQLARNVGAQRAAWIIRATDPTATPSQARGSGFDIAVAARLLPDRFAVVALSAGDPVNVAAAGAQPQYVSWTASVPHPLPLGLLDKPDAASWLNDLTAATAAGMAVSIPVPAGAPPIDMLLVVGLHGATNPDLAGLLVAHAYTDGVEILADGAPTNNSSQITAAHTRGRESDVARALIEPPPAPAPPDGSAGAQVATLLGIPAAQVTRIAGAHQPRATGAAAMQLVVGYGSTGQLATLLEADAAWGLVSPGGPAPTLRLGRQPYGILPASAPARWRAQTSETGAVLQPQLNAWGQAVGPTSGVDPLTPPPHVGAGSARHVTPADDTQLLELLVEAASSVAYEGQDASFAGPEAIVGENTAAADALRQIAAATPTDLASLEPMLPSTLLTKVAIAAKQHAASLGANAAAEVTRVDSALGALADLAGAPSGQGDLLRLLTETLDAASHRFDAWVTGALFERLVRQRPGATTARVGAYGWLTDLEPREDARSHGHVLAPSVAHAATAAVLRSGFLGQRRQAWAARLADAEAAASAAQALVEQREAELAAAQRGPQPQGVAEAINHLNQAQQALNAAEQTVNSISPLTETLPPLDASSEADLPLSIDLSSERVRAGRRTLRAVQTGQPLAAVLGYQFERDLVTADMQRYLSAFRKLSRFQTGTALEALEEARAAAEHALAAAQSKLADLEADQGAADQALAAATAAQQAAQAALSRAQQAASPWHQLQYEAAGIAIGGDQRAIQALGPRPAPTVRHIPMEIPVIEPGDRVGRQSYQLQTIDADTPSAATAWQQQYTQLNRKLDSDRARLAQIGAMLAAPAAVAQLQAESSAQNTLAAAEAAEQNAQEQRESKANAADAFKVNDLQAAQAALDAATKAVSDALAALLASAHTSTALTSTVDGLALRARYQAALAATPPLFDHTTIPFRATTSTPPVDPELDFPAVGDADYAALRAVLDQLDAHVDEVADLITAEAVHQLVQGNQVRSGAALDVAASGSVPDELEVIRTPRPAYDTTHRVLVLIDPALTPAWGLTADVGAHADPVLAAWLSHHLPNPATVNVTARLIDPAGAGVASTLTVNGAQISADPLGWVRMAADPSELQQRIAHAAREQAAGSLGAAAASRTVVIDAPAGPFAELIAPAAALRTVMASARALGAGDLALPPAAGPAPSAAAAAAVAARVQDVEKLVGARADALAAAAAGSAVGALVDALFAVSSLGEASATPQMLEGTPELGTLRIQADQAVARLRQRLQGTPFAADPQDPAETLTRARARLAALCGMTLPGLATVAIPTGGHFSDDLKATPTRLTDAGPARVRQWLANRARVRPAVEAMLALYDTVEALVPGSARLDARATQLPDGTATPITWVGPQGLPPPGGLNLVVQRGFSDPLPGTVAGLFIDGWTESVPERQHSPAVAFHYDQPDSTPPQAILVAIAPDPTPGRQPATWDLDTLLDTLTSTFALARDRAAPAELRASAGVTIGPAA